MKKYLLMAAAIISFVSPVNAAPPPPIATGSIEAILQVAEGAYKCGIDGLSIRKYPEYAALFIATSGVTLDAIKCTRDWVAANASRLNITSYISAPLPTPPKNDTAGPLEIEFWYVGDDGLSNKFHQAVSDSLKASGKFSEGGKNETSLIFYAPTNVGWKNVGGRTEVRYSFEFWKPREKAGLDAFKPSEMGSLVDKMEGTCWEDEMPKCAADVIKRATKVALKQ